jgi:thiol-disulfide isomerase/thioredoxin
VDQVTAPSLRLRWLAALGVAALIAVWPIVGQKADGNEHAGEPANFAFKLKDMNGAAVDLASYKGRPLIINFWATWCPPCKLEIPWFIEFKKQYGDKGLEVLGVSLDDPADELVKFAAEYKMNYPVLMGLDQDKMLETYDAVAVVPVTWFIKRDGTVQAKHVGISSREYFENMVKALF